MSARSPRQLVVTFHKVATPPPLAWWEAVRPTGGNVRGGHMPIGRGVIPHDLGHMATESYFDLDDGFWGLLARGATFKRGTDRRPTRPGRALVAGNRAGLRHAEELGNEHHWAWVCGKPTPVKAIFDDLARQWSELPHDGTLTIRWPSLKVEPTTPI